MTRFPRLVTGSAALAAAALALTACSGGGAGTDDEAGNGVLRYYSYWTEGEPTAAIFAEAIKDFEAETGIKVEVQWQGRDLPEILAPLLTSSNPDVDLVDFGCSGIKDRLLSTGKAADLSGVLAREVSDGETVADVVTSAALATGKADGETFCVPFELTSNFDLWYNATTHPDLTSDSAATWDDFIGLLDESGPGTLALDGTIGSYTSAWFINAAVSAGGPGSLLAAASDKTGEAFKSPEMVAAAEAMQQLVDGGYFVPGYAASKFPAIQQKWADNEADYILNGSWLPAEVAPYAAPDFAATSLPFPAIGAKGIRPMQIDSIGFGAIKGSPNLENAEKFIAFFLQSKYQDQIGQLAIPARGDAEAAPSLTAVTAALGDDSVTKIRPYDGLGDVAPGWGDEVLGPLVQGLMFGEIDAATFIAEVSAASKSFWDLQG